MLFIDARNYFTVVDRTLNEWNDWQLKNMNAIVWLYCGETDKYQQLIEEYHSVLGEGDFEMILQAQEDCIKELRSEARDIYKDLHDLQKGIDENDPENSALDSISLELFEDISYIMAKHADPQGVPNTPDEWLDQFGTFSIYQVLPEIIELWGLNVQTQIESKKTSTD